MLSIGVVHRCCLVVCYALSRCCYNHIIYMRFAPRFWFHCFIIIYRIHFDSKQHISAPSLFIPQRPMAKWKLSKFAMVKWSDANRRRYYRFCANARRRSVRSVVRAARRHVILPIAESSSSSESESGCWPSP